MIARLRHASFPWYDLPEMRAAVDTFYATLAATLERRGVDGVPAALDRSRPQGTDPHGSCFFTQTCGYPLFTTARDHFRVLGAHQRRAGDRERRADARGMAGYALRDVTSAIRTHTTS